MDDSSLAVSRETSVSPQIQKLRESMNQALAYYGELCLERDRLAAELEQVGTQARNLKSAYTAALQDTK